jgi:N-acetylglutamate synthase-like GNAT family acetyltransferase
MAGACLLQTAIVKATTAKCSHLYLGTMDRFTAAQRFYEKNGFENIPGESLPAGFPANSVDTVFYRKEL